MDTPIEARRTLAGVGSLVMLILFLGVLVIGTIALLTNGLAFFGL